VTPNDFLQDGHAPFSSEIRSKMGEVRDKLRDLSEKRSTPDRQEQVRRYVANLENLIEQGEAENVERTANLTRAAGNPGNVERVEFPATRTAGTPDQETRSSALREVERHKVEGAAADRLERVIRSEPNPVHARYIKAVASDDYASAWRKTIRDRDRAVLELTNDERAAMIEVREAEEFRAMSIGTPSAGGFALPLDLDPSLILTNDGSINPLRAISRVESITQKSRSLVTTDGVTAAYGAEGSAVTEVTPTLAQPEVVTHRATAFVKASFELFQDWSGIQTELARVFADARDNLEADKFLTGTGADEPEGLLLTLPTSFANPDAVSEFIAMQNALGARYQPGASWLMNLAGINAAGQLVAAADTSDAPIIDGNGRLLRKPVNEASYMPDSNVVYGDFRQGFVIADRLGFSVELVPHVYDGSGNLMGQRGLLAVWRSGSLVINPDAFVLGGLGS